MKEKTEKKLYDAYPELFQQKDLGPNETCMCFGCCCGDGWYGLLDWFGCWSEWVKKTYRVQIKAVQVKEKFAGLRIYVDLVFESEWNEDGFLADSYVNGKHVATTDEAKAVVSKLIRDFIDTLEVFSFHVCEDCGTTIGVSKRINEGWHSALCDKCQRALERRRKWRNSWLNRKLMSKLTRRIGWWKLQLRLKQEARQLSTGSR